ncbi:MAG TPA: NAD(P)-dependent oxidoreductase [Patescibacteria group bacterium]|nr:NAD(P)-dependent oxidoreductase [Patescibacteria group bacterium]
MKKTVAVVGTGIMGKGIADNFLKNKYKVYVWNRNPKRLTTLIKKGAIKVNSPREAAEMADIVFEVTANDESSKAVWLGKDGIIAGAKKDSILITCATLSIEWTEQLAKLAKQVTRNFFDMPMTGGRTAAESGKLFLLVGGDENKLKAISSDLKAIAGSITYFGKAGSGMKFKLLLNTLQAIHGVALGEVLRVAKETGQDVKKVGDFLSERPGGTSGKGAWINYQNPPKETSFSLNWMTKDLRYTKKMVRSASSGQAKFKTPLLDDTLAKLETGIKKNMGEGDWTNINKLK